MIKFRFHFVAATAIFLLASGVGAGTSSQRAYSSGYQPISVESSNAMVPGQSLPVAVAVQGPAEIHVYSDPPGAVTYDGAVDGTTATVPATTDPNATGNVTVYLATDGESVVSTSVAAQ